jgi:hypothetical protein
MVLDEHRTMRLQSSDDDRLLSEDDAVHAPARAPDALGLSLIHAFMREALDRRL